MGLTHEQKRALSLESNHIEFMTYQVTIQFPVILLF